MNITVSQHGFRNTRLEFRPTYGLISSVYQVAMVGLEPATSRLQVRYHIHCATPPHVYDEQNKDLCILA